MLAVVIYDSAFGNTEKIAHAVARGAEALASVRVVNAAEATAHPPERPDLLLVGGPTQRHGAGPTLSAFLDSLPRPGLRGVPAATFDTRYRMSTLLSGSAARQAAGRLRRVGCRMVAEPESFFIERDRPPDGGKRRHEVETLEAGELERAEAWGRAVAGAAAGR